ncbi:MAG: autotransporter outer membrane beta-barrel domain-containing protein [Pseudomonadota bacterium]
MTKVAGVAASFAPAFGTLMSGVASVALGTAITVSGAAAGSCSGGAGTYTCSGPATAGDTTQTFTNAAGVTVTTEPGFGIDTSGTTGDAFTLTAGPGGGVVFDDQNSSDITGADVGINATVVAGGTSIAITTTGIVAGGTDGIYASNAGTGDLTITSANGGTALVTGSTSGIYASNTNGGAVTITADNVSATGADGNAIQASNDVSGTSLSITTSGTVTSLDGYGIYALSLGSGSVTIDTSNADGTGLVSGVDGAIQATDVAGTGVSVTVDNATASNGTAIAARKISGAGDVRVTVNGTVNGSNEGITAVNRGTGDVIVTATNAAGTASVSGLDNAIYAANYAGGSLNVSTNNVSAFNGDGIRANNELGTDSLTVTTSGMVASTNEDGIDATNRGAGNLTITSTGSVSGGEDGIRAENYLGGAVIVSAEDVTGGTDYYGIYATNDSYGSTLDVTTTGTVTGGMVGIFAGHSGTDDLTITASNASGTAQVSGMGAIVAIGVGQGAVNIEADNTTGMFDAIYANNGPDGTSISITARGTTLSDVYGITAINSGSSGVTITAETGPVMAGVDGITAVNNNGGAIAISAANVTGTANDGIYAYNDEYGSTLTVTASGIVTGGDEGIEAVNFGNGNVSVMAQDGTQTAQVSGGENGIDVYNFNGGAVTVMADNATATVNDAISVVNDNYGSSVSVTVTGTVMGGDDGIEIYNYGNEGLTVTATNSAGTAMVSGVDKGIAVRNFFGGMLSVTADNAAATTEEDGIYTFNDNLGTTSIITTYGSVTGAENGIYARHYGSGALSVTVSGATQGTTNSGIDAQTGLGGQSIITLNAGADVSGGTYAILNAAGNSNTYVNTGATLSGVTSLGDGSDVMTIADATITGVTSLDGGDDSDTADGFVDVLRFSGFNGSFSADLMNWEEVVFNASNAEFTGAAITAPTVSLQNGTTFSPSQPGFVLNAPLTVDASSSFDAGLGGAGAVVINGNVVNSGMVTVSDGTVGDQLTINGDVSGAGSFGVDADVVTGTGDLVTITGNAPGTGSINVTAVTATDTPMDVTVLGVVGATSAGAFTLGSANFVLPNGQAVQVVGNLTYALEFDGAGNAFVFTAVDPGGAVTNNPVGSLLEGWAVSVTQPYLVFSSPVISARSSGNSVSRGDGTGSVMRNFFELDPSPENAIWVSLSAGQADLDGRSTTGARFDTDLSEFEMGIDMPVFEGQAGRLVAGAAFSLTEARVGVVSTLGTGVVNTKAGAATLSATWMTDNRFYAHGQLRYSVFSSDFFVGGASTTGVQTKGWATSLEIGQAFDVSDRLTLMPQLQILHGDVSGESVADPFGSTLVGTITDGSVTTARVGLMAERATVRGSLHGTLSYIHALDADTSVAFGGNTFTTRYDPNRVELRAGGQMAIGDNSILHGGLTVQGALGDFSDDNAVSLTGGIRVKF